MGKLGNVVRKLSPQLHACAVSVKRGEFEVFPPRRVYAEKPLHRLIKQLLAGRPGYFIEAGANDGITRSNTYYLERHCGWKGILVEPIPYRAKECKANRAKSVTYHAALVSESGFGDVEIVDMDRMSMVLSEANALKLEDHMAHFKSIRREYRHEEPVVTRHKVQSKTLDEILAVQGYPHVNLLSLDVEGLEVQVLKGLNLDKTKPDYLLVEDWDKQGVRELLTSKGYRVHAEIGSKDTLFSCLPA